MSDVLLTERAAPGDQDTENDIEECLNEIQDILACLLDLLPVLRYPMAEECDQEDLGIHDPALYTAEVYRDVAKMLFPNAPDYLCKCLAQNSVRARNRLRRLRYKGKSQPNHADHKRHASTLISTRVKSLLKSRGAGGTSSTFRDSTLADSDGGTTAMPTHYQSTIAASDASYLEKSSIPSTVESQPHELVQRVLNHRILEKPSGQGDYGRAECPYCHYDVPMVDVSKDMTSKEWLAHVYLDLRPYVCTFEQCPLDNIPFGDKDMWFQHEMDHHRFDMEWSCVYCTADFTSEDEFKQHLQSDHETLSALNTTSLFVDSCKRYSARPSSVQMCTICHTDHISTNALKNCLANHLELFTRAATLDIEQLGSERHDVLNLYLDEQLTLRESTSSVIASSPLDSSTQNAFMAVAMATVTNKEGAREKVRIFVEDQFIQNHDSALRRNVPDRDNQFFGRVDNLNDTHVALSTAGRMCVISGHAGIGKTAAAIEYAYRFEKAYSYTFWIDAESEGRRVETFGMIAEALELDKRALPDENARTYIIRDALANISKDWLLIFDNADKWSEIARYIPPNLTKTKGSVLITAREIPQLLIPGRVFYTSISLDPLALKDACRCLLFAMYSKLNKEEVEGHVDYPLATKVVEAVKRLPLAITIVVGYITMSRCTLDEFLEMWDENDSRMRKKRQALKQIGEKEDTNGTIGALWEIGIREVDRNSRRLLDIMSFLSSDGIPKDLLVGDHKEEFLEFLNQSETIRLVTSLAVWFLGGVCATNARRLSFRRMIKQLSGRRLIHLKLSANGEEEAYGIHRLLQSQIHLDMNDYSFADAFRKVFHLLRRIFPRGDPKQIPRRATWALCKKYMPHLLSFHLTFQKNAHRSTIDRLKTPALAELFYDAGFYVWSCQGTGYDGLEFLKSADAILDENKAAADAILRANIHCMAGLLLLNLGVTERRQGTKRLQEARRMRQVIFEKDPTPEKDVMFRNAANDYALCLLNLHKFDEAATIFEGCFRRYQVWGSEENNPFEYSKYYGNYSVVLMWQGKTQEAIDSMKRCLEYTEKFSGRKAQYYRRQFMLACQILQHGDVSGALEMHLAILNARLGLHGKLHEFTMDSTYAVGRMYHHVDDIPNAM